MEVVILCGGLGTRLREEIELRPKPMVNTGSRPILWHIIKYFFSLDVRILYLLIESRIFITICIRIYK